MVENIVSRGKKFLVSPQSTIVSAAFVIMLMNVVSAAFGIVRHRILLTFFDKEQYALYLAAFRLPDMTFEIFALGLFSAAFIPVFAKLHKQDEKEAWDMSARVLNLTLVIFSIFAITFAVFAGFFYKIVTPTIQGEDFTQVVFIARLLFIAQVFFVISYVVSGILESMQRFLIPAIAPLFYNLGIILGTAFFAPTLGLLAPALGAVVGALAHMLIQLPIALHLGFRFRFVIRPNLHVKKIGKLALPRLAELGILQILKTSELYFASIISVVSYTYLYLANSLQAVAISLFAVSLAKASMPTLARQDDEPAAFRKTFLATLYQMFFIIIPVATFLIVLRIPIVRLFYGTDIFDWSATVQTGLVLTTFAIGMPFQAGLILLSRAFYAIHDTKTPVKLAIFDVFATILLNIIFVVGLGWPVWSIALASSIAGIISFSILFVLLSKRMSDGGYFKLLPIAKILVASVFSGSVMFFLLKLFDRSVWVKRLSFLNTQDVQSTFLRFQGFVLDTRYTANLLILTIIVSLIGGSLYLLISYLFKSEELLTLTSVLKRPRISSLQKDGEQLTSQTDTNV